MKKSLRFRDIVTLAFGTMIGWGWITLTGGWVISAGSLGAGIAFVLGAVMCIFVGMVYCELTPMLPYTGGVLVYTYRAMGYSVSWFAGWMLAFAYIGVVALEGPALATAIDFIVPIPRIGYLFTVAGFDVYMSWYIIPALVALLLTGINFRGIKASAVFQTIATVVLAVGGVILLLSSIFSGDIKNIQPMVKDGSGIRTVILAVPTMFVGFDVIPQVAEEMNISSKKIPKAIIGSIVLAAAWYIMVIFSTALSAPQSVYEGKDISVVYAVVHATNNPVIGYFIIVSAAMGILTSWNGFIIGASRVLYSMGRARMLPKIFGELHPKYKTPWFPIVFIGIITMGTPLLGKNSLTWFVNASALGTVIAYLMVSISFLVLRRKEPELHRPYRVKNGIAVGGFAVISSLLFCSLYLPIGSSSLTLMEWSIVGVWIGIGMICYLMTAKNKHRLQTFRNNIMYGYDDEINDG